ncbi:nucleotidyltransferase domain-containing protein [Enhygromyxa salina]|uniref:Nucleotidyltransferase domain protein n=1 Tax=Enhygromyxa salina TaxID=215803 RepID=A0A2S9YTS4_9BACT|nr:nucleotidyltransferase domain-containing protein [Enhygromyxa salina]PRQ08439.1 Nucleotidyltransferase domain protein [Enhygromyxa salina]
MLASAVPQDTSFVAFGSLARGELTSGSDLDWTLLLDGPTDKDHHKVVKNLYTRLEDASVKAPGPSGVFGSMVSSYPILHQIGGQDDTNRNTTQRILLLLESTAIGRSEAHERVLRLVIERYVEDDRGLLYSRATNLVPRVLLNDIARYWRTVTIDFVDKQKHRSDGWALRNVKLRLSRKLIYISGLLTCFSLELHADKATLIGADDRPDPARLVDFMLGRVRCRPLDTLAAVCLRPGVQPATARALFDSYDAFLGVLDDADRRDHLRGLSVDDLGKSEVFRDVSRLARRFQDDGVHRLFFEEDAALRDLITRYGVF